MSPFFRCETCSDARWVTVLLCGIPVDNWPCPDCNDDGAAPYEPTELEMEERGQAALPLL